MKPSTLPLPWPSRVCAAVGLLLAVSNNSRAIEPFANWNETYRTNAQLQAVTFGANLFVAVGDDATVLTSPDGRNWTRRSVTVTGANPNLNGVAYGVVQGVGKYVAVGEFTGRILHSTDGVNWSLASASSSPAFLKAVAFGGGSFIAVGDSGQIYSSTNSTTWNKVYDAGGNLEGVAYGNGRFVAVYGTGSTLASSDNGLTWSAGGLNSVLGTTSRAVGFGSGRFVLADSNGNIVLTTNGTSILGSANLVGKIGKAFAATYAQDCFLLAGVYANLSYIAFSTNGTNWIDRPLSNWSFVLRGIAAGNNTVVAVGENSATDQGLVLTHDIPRAPEIIQLPENRAVQSGLSVPFSVGTWKTLEESYQWFLNDQPIPGATQQSLLVTNVQPEDTGRYTVRVSNALGSITTTNGGLLTSYNRLQHAGLTLSNAIGSRLQIEYRDSLSPADAWLVLTNFVLPQAPLLLIEAESPTLHPQRYFRSVTTNGSPAGLAIALYQGFSIWGLPGSTCRIEYQDTQFGPWNTLTNLTLGVAPQVWFDDESGGRPGRKYRCTAGF